MCSILRLDVLKSNTYKVGNNKLTIVPCIDIAQHLALKNKVEYNVWIWCFIIIFLGSPTSCEEVDEIIYLNDHQK